MSEVSNVVASQVDTLADKNATLAALEPELGGAINAVAALAEKAVIKYGYRLAEKVFPTLKTVLPAPK